MIISPQSFWLTGKPRQILAYLAQLAQQHDYVAEVIASKRALIER